MTEIFDTHAHLDFPDFDRDRDDVIRRAKEAGVARIITIGTSVEGSRRAITLAEKYEGVFASVGIHPNDCTAAADDAVEQLRDLARHPKVVAIGETGLDYHYLPSKQATHLRQLAEPPLTIVGSLPTKKSDVADPSDLEVDILHKIRQLLFFRRHLELAADVGKAVVIHQRDAFEDVIETIANFIKESRGKQVRGVFHCFGENLSRAEEVLSLGFNISFTGILTFKNARELVEVAKTIALEKIMVETDCPYLAPHPFRGKRCEPGFVRVTAEKLAELRGESLETVAAKTSETARQMFWCDQR